MTNFLKSIFVLSLCLLSPYLIAEENKSPIYFEIGTGMSFNSGKNTEPGIDMSTSDREFKNKGSVPVSASFGYRYSSDFRFDVNVTYLPSMNINLQGSSSDNQPILVKSSLSSFSTGLNAYYDFTNFSESGVTPYITGGVGMSQNKIGDSSLYVDNEQQAQFSSNTDTSFMWKLGVGVQKKINESIFVDLSYKFADLGVAKSGTGSYYINGPGFYNSDVLKFKNLYSNQVVVSIGINF